MLQPARHLYKHLNSHAGTVTNNTVSEEGCCLAAVLKAVDKPQRTSYSTLVFLRWAGADRARDFVGRAWESQQLVSRTLRSVQRSGNTGGIFEVCAHSVPVARRRFFGVSDCKKSQGSLQCFARLFITSSRSVVGPQHT